MIFIKRFCINDLFYIILVMNKVILSNSSFSIIIPVIGGIGAALYSSFDKYIVCSYRECCNEKYSSAWIKGNMTELENGLKEKVHGQSLANDVIVRAIKSHLNTNKPSKALVMSFHGWTGSGKNHVSKIIADSIYEKGMMSEYVHLFLTTVLFPHEDEADIYKLQIQDWIRGNVSNCDRSLFIFDEIDKMPAGMIDAIKPFIDHHESIFGIDFRKSMFIFLSNTGSREIVKRTLDIWKSGVNRENITLENLEDLVELGAFNEKGGLHNSELIQHSLVDHYIPFLPLEKKHVVLCIKDELRQRGYNPNAKEMIEIISKVVDGLQFFPSDLNLFSVSGCKRIASKVGYILTDRMYDTMFD